MTEFTQQAGVPAEILGSQVVLGARGEMRIDGEIVKWKGDDKPGHEAFRWWVESGWACVVGAEREEFAVLAGSPLGLVASGWIPRIRHGGIGTAGMFRLSWWPVAAGVVVETELGGALITPTGCAWFADFRDLTSRVSEVTDGSVTFAGDGWASTMSVRP